MTLDWQIASIKLLYFQFIVTLSFEKSQEDKNMITISLTSATFYIPNLLINKCFVHKHIIDTLFKYLLQPDCKLYFKSSIAKE